MDTRGLAARKLSGLFAGANAPVPFWRNPDPPAAMTDINQNSRLILAVAQRRDRESFRALFVYFAPRIKGYLIRRGMNGSAADEIAQETLLMVWRKAGHFDPSRASASTWIFTIARNLHIDQLRRGVRLPDDYYPGEEPVSLPSDEYSAFERDEKVSEALQILPEEQSEVIRLSFFEEVPHPVIAARLGIPLGTVKSRLRLAMNRLRKALEGMQ
jgi:RNA polymerase sigma-70 factor (ECF subfamily)